MKKEILSLDSLELSNLRLDVDMMLRRMIHLMESHESDEGIMNIKVEVKFIKQYAEPDANGECEEMNIPVFKHDITTQLQVKEKKSGCATSQKKLVFNKAEGDYYFVPVDENQKSMFDEEDLND